MYNFNSRIFLCILFTDIRTIIRGAIINKDNLITQLENSLRVTLDYRMKIGNGEPQYTRMTVSW